MSPLPPFCLPLDVLLFTIEVRKALRGLPELHAVDDLLSEADREGDDCQHLWPGQGLVQVLANAERDRATVMDR